MPRMTFSSENKVNQRDDFPKLKLEQNEKARIFCPELPVAEYIHNLRMPKVGPDGKQSFKTVQDKDGNDKQVPEFDFVSRPLCLGKLETLEEQGADPKNCQMCREALKSDHVERPQRRFAMHVVRYAMKSDGSPASPYQASVAVWSFTDFMFTKLVDIATEYACDLSALDLVLTCKTALYQQYDIMASENTWRKKDAKWIPLTDEVFKENQAKELSTFCGQKKARDFIDADLQKIEDRYDEVNGRKSVVTVAETASLAENLDGLLEGSAPTTTSTSGKTSQEPKAESAESLNWDEMFK